MQMLYADELQAPQEEREKAVFVNKPAGRLKPKTDLSTAELGEVLSAAVKQIPIYKGKKPADLLPLVYAHSKLKQNERDFFAIVTTNAFKFFYDIEAKKIAFSRDHALRAVPPRARKVKIIQGAARTA